ncbi:ATP-dependent DNA ligase domain protein [Aeromicrobium marinum DSM 15272]|uniref:DNA ligase (ATP) n=1 Tax=Aeromicrobium marinum DSM 15272 TaxID=585531 RepID=E2SA27_9ACTN|nr:ATP-dependent DNA ligase [Aeromicrobium marinum]EFQ84101.1 ATP-dependent DNA ligase domain protein [Aeromicrobium marinum DSM 15272]
MDLPVMPPLVPMLAKSAARVPGGDAGMLFEPKWDGFRCLVFRDGDEVELASRSTKSLARYFPDVVQAVLRQLPERCVVDAEIVVAVGDRLDFDTLSARIHPAASRVDHLAEQTPARLVVFDLLALGDESLLDTPLAQRRSRLEDALAGVGAPVHLTRTTTDPAEAEQWFAAFEGAGLDGVMAKSLTSVYVPGGRTMIKVKHARTADVVVAGYRPHKNSTEDSPLLGSMLLGLYAGDGTLRHVGVCASFTAARRAELVEELAGDVVDLSDHPWGDLEMGQNRWSAGKDLSFVPLAPVRVAEVGYEHMEGPGDTARFRHTAQFKRWRPDREATSCTYAQLEEVVGYRLSDVLT